MNIPLTPKTVPLNKTLWTLLWTLLWTHPWTVTLKTMIITQGNYILILVFVVKRRIETLSWS
jgi:hypothetical protein